MRSRANTILHVGDAVRVSQPDAIAEPSLLWQPPRVAAMQSVCPSSAPRDRLDVVFAAISCLGKCRNSEKLSSFFTLLSDTPDANGQDYISIIEAKRYPFIAVQFHPEQPCFEWHNPKVPHSTNAVRLSQALSLAFVEVWPRISHCKQAGRALLGHP